MEEPVVKTVMQLIIESMADAFSLVGKVIEQITAQPLLLFLLAAALIPVGIGIFMQLKNAARG